LLIADLRTLESVANPSQPIEMKMMLRLKTHATITLMLSVPFLFLKEEAFSRAMEIGI
jgi:hypothetical protein